MPELQRASERFDPARVQFIAVGSGSLERLESLRQSRGLKLPVPIATDAFREALGVVGFPETLFIDARGHIVERLMGGQTAEWFEARVHQLLAEEAARATAAKQEAQIPAKGAPVEATGRHRWYEKLVYRLVRKFR